MSLLEAIKVSKTFTLKRLFKKHHITALRDVTVKIPSNSITAIVGESGSGKSTLARILLALEEPDKGHVLFNGTNIRDFNKSQWRQFRRSVSVIFQDPFASLNPRMSVYSILAEPLKIHNLCSSKELRQRVIELLKAVELSPEHINRYPHEFSGGQRQRLCIARALALEPQVIIADEPLSALDVSIQAQIINLLKGLRTKRNLSIFLVSHDLEMVHYLAEYVYIMYRGRILEEGFTEEIFKEPLHPYTKLLLSAVPRIYKPRQSWLYKNQNILTNERENGCVFYARCSYRAPICSESEPSLKDLTRRKVACFLY